MPRLSARPQLARQRLQAQRAAPPAQRAAARSLCAMTAWRALIASPARAPRARRPPPPCAAPPRSPPPAATRGAPSKAHPPPKPPR
eukprot:361719-Chlamydomonas_euryale.AAC.4